MGLITMVGPMVHDGAAVRDGVEAEQIECSAASVAHACVLCRPKDVDAKGHLPAARRPRARCQSCSQSYQSISQSVEAASAECPGRHVKELGLKVTWR